MLLKFDWINTQLFNNYNYIGFIKSYNWYIYNWLISKDDLTNIILNYQLKSNISIELFFDVNDFSVNFEVLLKDWKLFYLNNNQELSLIKFNWDKIPFFNLS